MTFQDLEALLEDIDFMTIIYCLFDFEESGTLTISGWSKNLRTNLGYDTYMIYVNTSLDVALERNAMRPRSIPTPIVTKSWNDVQKNLGHDDLSAML